MCQAVPRCPPLTTSRLIEGTNINRSLLALANCINALSEGSEKGGNARSVQIFGIDVSIEGLAGLSGSFDDASNTLKYANRTKNLKTRIERNVHNVSFHINKYNEIISQLQEEIVELRVKISVQGHHTTRSKNVDSFALEIDKHLRGGNSQKDLRGCTQYRAFGLH